MTKRAGKKKRSAAPRAKDLKTLRNRLEEKREQILAMYRSDLRAGQESADQNTDDIVDRANNAYNRELLFSLSDAERQLLIEVDSALRRVEKKEYGDCEACSEPIALPRLQAVPWARYCIDCQELSEKGMLQEA